MEPAATEPGAQEEMDLEDDHASTSAFTQVPSLIDSGPEIDVRAW